MEKENKRKQFDNEQLKCGRVSICLRLFRNSSKERETTVHPFSLYFFKLTGMLSLLCTQNEIAANPGWLQGDELRRSGEEPARGSAFPAPFNRGLPRKASGAFLQTEGTKPERRAEERLASGEGGRSPLGEAQEPPEASHAQQRRRQKATRRRAAPTCARTKRRRPPPASHWPPSQPSRRKTRGSRGWWRVFCRGSSAQGRAERRP